MSLEEKTILITGGTGSFGKKFIELALKAKIDAIRVFSRGEYKQLKVRKKFKNNSKLRFFIGDVRDEKRLSRAVRGVDVVVHAAALKQITAAEYNPLEAIKTNIDGARNVINAALEQGVSKVMALSTDKAVNPVNLYGATKLCAEKLFVQANSYAADTGTQFSCVRYGNVLGSRGSVIPLFRKQSEQGKITITDKRMTRFWITLKEGVEFVMSCINKMKGGEVFVPKLPSSNIMDLAEAIAPEAKKEVVGIRPGEKLHEVLISKQEARHTKEFEDFFVIEPEHDFWGANNWKEGKELSDGFVYDSKNNDDKLSVSEVTDILKKID
ncbi:MAG: UDP-N-acetylglucosamine 4,6-dehydratase (inverting) [Candidatus Magasanikbacteria bacterium]